MKRLLLTSVCALVGCGSATTFVHSDTTTLGRVVIYRNGVAYFERYAEIQDDSLKLSVPADKVDDFLKSLTVVDAQTGQPAPIGYPSDIHRQGSSLIDMKITLPGPRPHRLKLSYVTEAPSWKPSYRIVLGKGGKVDLEAWAVVDNTSGEDWNNVKLGVGSSSALSFRFDLRSIRTVQRETLHANDLFAQAPPMGGSTYADARDARKIVVGDLSDDVIAANEQQYAQRPAPVTAPTAHAGASNYHGGGYGGGGRGAPAASATARPVVSQPPADQGGLAGLALGLRGNNQNIIVEGFATEADGNKETASLDRANRVREQLVRQGVDPSRVVAVGKGNITGRAGGVRIVQAPGEEEKKSKDAPAEPAPAASTEPIGTSHFESNAAMSVPRGTSAMVSILHRPTDGEVVYLYDKESVRGNSSFPFRSVRIKNPTDSALEQGPVTVFGDGRFIGEGLSEPIPAHSMAFVPFALDRQIVVESKDIDRDQIERIITVQRGVFSTEVKHTKKTTVTLHNRLGERATVYVRHTVTPGFTLAKGTPSTERLGPAHLFRVDLEPHAKGEVVIEEDSPLFKTMDIRTPAGMEVVRVFLSSAVLHGPLKTQVAELMKLQQDMGNSEQRITTVREQMGEYRQRMDELHAQILTLKLVRTAGPLMHDLEKKLQEVGDRLSKATIDVVALQEKLMIARIAFQDGVADLSLEKKSDTKAASTQ